MSVYDEYLWMNLGIFVFFVYVKDIFEIVWSFVLRDIVWLLCVIFRSFVFVCFGYIGSCFMILFYFNYIFLVSFFSLGVILYLVICLLDILVF